MNSQTSGQRTIVVLGVGRSGTSTATRALKALGVDLGDRLRRGRGKNPTGFFEDRDLININRKLKRSLGIQGASARLIDREELLSPRFESLRQAAAEIIRRRFGDVPLWGYKDGRTLRLLPFWDKVYRDAGLDVSYLFASRNPISVARSRGKLDARRGFQDTSDSEWMANAVPYFRLACERRLVVIDYDNMMADPETQLRRIARRLDLPVTDAVEAGIQAYATDFLRPGLRHTQFSDDDLDEAGVHRLVRDAYRWLHRLSIDEIELQSSEFWLDWARIEAEVADLAPMLCQIDRLEDELNRARWHPLGPLQSLPRLWRWMTARI